MLAFRTVPRAWRALPALLTILALLACPRPVPAASSLRLEMEEIAKGLKQLLTGRGEDSVAVGAFTGPSGLEASAGPGIAQALCEELQKLGVTVKRRANLEIKGDYLDVVAKKSDRLAALLKVRVLDRSGNVVAELERGIFGEASLSALFGMTAHLPPGADAKARDQRLRDSLDHPAAVVDGSRIAAASGSPFAVEVLVAPGSRQAYQPRPAQLQEGQAFVPIRRGEVYAVRLSNQSDQEAAATLTIDGLNVFVFSDVKDPKTGQARYSMVVVGPRSSVTIRGWHRTNEVSEEFLVTDYGRSAAAELKSPAAVGTITACFAAVWPKDGKPPADEPASPNDNSRAADATGRGARIGEKYTEVERHVGVVRAAISVRYTK